MATRKKKATAPETKRQQLERELEEQAARARASHRHGLPDSGEQQHRLRESRAALGRELALEHGHSPLRQGISFECWKCGASGSFDVEPVGFIFTKKCGT